jgi:N-6 DNA Methylase
MSELVDRLRQFVRYWESLSGDEKGEAQVFVDRLFQAFGHPGYKEAGATLEWRVKGNDARRGTTYADLVWKPRLLMEMKKRGEKLNLHFRQAFDYWVHLVPNRPQYVILCNFDEFWIYDFDKQIEQPVDIVATRDIAKRYTALNFLFPEDRDPIFGNDQEAVTREAAELVGKVFRSLIKRGEDRGQAQRFVLQSVVAMFAEDVDLVPRGTVSTIVDDCFKGESSYDLFGGLFRQMNAQVPARAGRYRGVPYFNGGLFAAVDPVELNAPELHGIGDAAQKDWSQVNPAIFGTLFQASMDGKRRHTLGAHFTAEADIMKVVGPSVSRPWDERIAQAKTPKALLELRDEMLRFRVLDPACGSGNFLYVAYREMVRAEITLLLKVGTLLSPRDFTKRVRSLSLISPRQFFGIDRDEFAVELAKVTLLFGKKLALDEVMASLTEQEHQFEFDLARDHPLPLENLDANVICGDALFADWPRADAIIGNPPYQSKNKMQEEFGRAYLNKLRDRYPEVPGRADYCVYWFRRAHDELSGEGRAGLVGTNTIRQNYSREGGLDHIVSHGGTIVDAVSTQVWSGDAVVHVSIVNWVKGAYTGRKRLARQVGDSRDSPWEAREVKFIDAALSFSVDVTRAVALKAYAKSTGCFQGQTHGHAGFLVARGDAERLIAEQPTYSNVLFPYLTADELLGNRDSLPDRYVIDFGSRDLLEAKEYKDLFERIEDVVLPDLKERAREEKKRNDEALAADAEGHVAKDHESALDTWWQLFRRRGKMLAAIAAQSRYIVCGRVTKRPIFEFVEPSIHPNDALSVFPFEDDYSFGILQSSAHWEWFQARCSTLKGDFRYTSNTVFDSFVWPQSLTPARAREVADAALSLRSLRWALRRKHGLSLRELYRALETPGDHALNRAQEQLDFAVRAAYGMAASDDTLEFLLELNRSAANGQESRGRVLGPGLPSKLAAPDFVTADHIAMPRPPRLVRGGLAG